MRERLCPFTPLPLQRPVGLLLPSGHVILTGHLRASSVMVHLPPRASSCSLDTASAPPSLLFLVSSFWLFCCFHPLASRGALFHDIVPAPSIAVAHQFRVSSGLTLHVTWLSTFLSIGNFQGRTSLIPDVQARGRVAPQSL